MFPKLRDPVGKLLEYEKRNRVISCISARQFITAPHPAAAVQQSSSPAPPSALDLESTPSDRLWLAARRQSKDPPDE